MKHTEADGIAAIKYLQGLASVPETDEQARAGWQSMCKSEKDFTMQMYEEMKATDAPKETVETMIEASPDAQKRKKNDLARNKKKT